MYTGATQSQSQTNEELTSHAASHQLTLLDFDTRVRVVCSIFRDFSLSLLGLRRTPQAPDFNSTQIYDRIVKIACSFIASDAREREFTK